MIKSTSQGSLSEGEMEYSFDRCLKEYKILSENYEDLKQQADMLYELIKWKYEDEKDWSSSRIEHYEFLERAKQEIKTYEDYLKERE